jgi:hypothetical protein
MAHDELSPTYTLHEARTAGLTRAQLRDDGIRVSRGVYVSRAVPLSVRAAARALVPVLPDDAAFSHGTAAALLGAPVPHEWPLHVAVPAGSYRPRRRRLRVHVRDLHAGDVVSVQGLRLTSGPQTWLDLAADLPEDELVAVGDALYRAGHLDARRLAERLDRAAGTRGIARARRCAPALTPLSASRPESLIRWWIIDSNLPDPEVQVPVLDRWGREAAHGDLGYSRWKILVEYEGRQHAEREQFRRDVDRYSLMAADGWLVLRFADVHLRRRTAVIDRVASALRSRGASW